MNDAPREAPRADADAVSIDVSKLHEADQMLLREEAVRLGRCRIPDWN